MSETLAKQLEIKAGVMEMGERIAWGSDTSLMRQAAALLRSQAKEIERLKRSVHIEETERDKVEYERDTLRILLVAAERENEALRRDAERYRWLRRKTSGHRSDGGAQHFGFPTGICLPPVGNIMKGAVCQHLDAAIDAAMRQEEQG